MALLRRIGTAEHFIGRRIDGSTGVAGMLCSLVRELPLHFDTIPAAMRERVADNLLDLIATALLSNGEQAALPGGMTLVRAKQIGRASCRERVLRLV